MTVYAKVSLWLALLFMMGHNLYAHSHDNEGVASFCEKHDGQYSLIHLLAHLFETDLGEDHLECFAASDIHSSPALPVFGRRIPLFLFEISQLTAVTTITLWDFGPGCHCGRAPPFA